MLSMRAVVQERVLVLQRTHGTLMNLPFGLRIWHELLHAQKIDSDAMLRSPEFEEWLESQFSYVAKRKE